MKRLLLCLALIFGNLRSQLNEKEVRFIQKYLVTPEQQIVLDMIFAAAHPTIKELLDGANLKTGREELKQLFESTGFTVHALHDKSINHYETDGRPARVVLTHPDFPGYFIKVGFDLCEQRKNLSRIVFAEIINQAIAQSPDDFSAIGTIEKKLAHRIGRPAHVLNDFNYFIISPVVEGARPKKTNDGQLVFHSQQQHNAFYKLKHLVNYTDLCDKNFIIDNNLLYIIDTEIDHQGIKKILKSVLGERKSREKMN